MAIFSTQNPLAFTFGVLGNIVSFMVYLAPVPTFRRIVRKKSTEGFQSIPYLVAHFSAMLWIYYAFIKANAPLLLTINSFGFLIETVYLALYITYAPTKPRVKTLKLLIFFNIGVFSLIVLFCHFQFKGKERLRVLGWICLGLTASVFASPLSIVAQVIRTKRVDFMPFSLSFFLVLSAVMWFFYGLLEKDLVIMLPNVLGFILGLLQMALYITYKNYKEVVVLEDEEDKLPTTVKLPTTGGTPEVHPECSLPPIISDDINLDHQVVNQHNPEDDHIELIVDDPDPLPLPVPIPVSVAV